MPLFWVESESLQGPLDTEALDLIDELVATVVARSWVAL